MEIYQIKAFLAVARQLSFTEAANELNLTQPAVSAKIKSLEASLGTALFYRLGRKIELTAAGNYLLEIGPNLIDLEGRLIKGIEEIKQGKFNQLKIGCTPNIINGWLPKILFSYRQKYPEVDLQCLSFETVQEIYQAIAAGDIDVAFSEAISTDNKEDFEEIEAVPVDSFQYYLMVAADHRLASREWLSLRELTEEVWALPDDSTPDWMALAGRLSELGLQLSDFPNREVMHSPSLMNTFLSQGHYLGFASSFQFQTERKANLLTAISLQEFPLDFELFMLQSKRKKKRNHQPQAGISQKPLQQLIRLICARTEYSAHQKKSMPTIGRNSGLAPEAPPQIASKLPVHWQTSVHFGNQKYGYSGTEKSEPKTLTIAIGTQNRTIQTVTAGLIIQHLGLLEHFLPRRGRYRDTEYQVQWRDFTSGAPIVAGLQSDQLDIGILGDYPLLLSALSPTRTKSQISSAELPHAKTHLAKTRLVSFIASNPDGAGNTVIVPNRSPLTSLDDLRDRIIAVPFASAAHGMIMRTLARAELLSEVTLTSIDNLNIHRLTPRNPQADGYAYFAPLHDIASHQGKFRRLLESDAGQLPTFHGVVVREAFAEEHPELVIAYLKALIAAQYWYETTPSALSLVSNWVGLAPEIVAKTLSYQGSDGSGLFFPDTKIRTDWVKEHIQQLSNISGNEALSKIAVDDWIQPEPLEMALSTL